jgi:hypothetical protein
MSFAALIGANQFAVPGDVEGGYSDERPVFLDSAPGSPATSIGEPGSATALY